MPSELHIERDYQLPLSSVYLDLLGSSTRKSVLAVSEN